MPLQDNANSTYSGNPLNSNIRRQERDPRISTNYSGEIEKIRTPRPWFNKLLNIILIVAVALLAWAYYVKDRQLKTVTDPTVQAEVTKQAIEDAVARVGKLVLLPKGEVPQVMVVSDPVSAVKQQPALLGIVAGDQILAYLKSGKAIVYSPSRNIIVTILPLVTQGIQSQSQNQKETADDNDNDNASGTSAE